MSAIAITEMENHKEIWQKYFNDFVHHHLHLSAASSDLEQKLVQLTFTDVLSIHNKMNAIVIHCHMHLNHLDLAKVVASMKPLGQLAELKTDKHPLCPRDPEDSLMATLHTSKSALGSSNVSKFVIDSLFTALVDAIYSNSSKFCSVQKWYNSYRDTVSYKEIITLYRCHKYY